MWDRDIVMDPRSDFVGASVTATYIGRRALHERGR
jgi:hypothetical protein